MKRTLLFLLISFLSVPMLFSQNEGVRRCGTMEHLAYLKSLDPGLEQRMNANEFALQQIIQNNENNLKSPGSVITIPVVVHIVYRTTAENIADIRVTEQLNVLNTDYAGLNVHPMYSFPSTLKANCEVQFCLAQQKPDGSATTGIERRLTNKTSFTTNDYVKHYSTGGLDAWDPTKYMNIWVCNLGSSLLGYAQFPTSGINSTFGVVIAYNAFGITGAVAPFNLGGTASHEIGHCLNLYHIWGDDGTSCSGTDNCNDTPNQAGANTGMPTFPHVTCSNGPLGDMFMNFMDYTDDAGYSNFTPGQKARMQALFVTSGLLYSLSQSNGCLAPVPGLCNVPSGIGSSGISSTSATVSWGSVSGAVSYNFQYRVQGSSTWYTQNTTSTSVLLNGLTAATTYEYQVQTVCSSGNSNFSSIYTFLTTATSCTDIYESNNTLSTAKAIATGTNIYALIGTSTDLDYFKFNNTSSQKKIRITLTNLPADYDIRLYKSNGTQVGISQNGGTNNETIIYNNGNAGTYYIKVYGYAGAYNANLCYTLKAEISATNFRITDPGMEYRVNDNGKVAFSVFPNPSNSIVNIMYESTYNGNTSVKITDISGRLVYSTTFVTQEGLVNKELNLEQLKNGLYFIDVSNAVERYSQKLMISK